MSDKIKPLLYEQFSRLGKALASPSRLGLLDLLCQGEKSVETLTEQSGLGLKNVSAQLKVLRTARLVESRKAGQHVFYRLADEAVSTFWVSLRTLAERRLTEVGNIIDRHRLGRQSLTPADRRELLSKAKAGELLLIDVRPEDEFRSGHFPHAVSIPLEVLIKRLKESRFQGLRKNLPIVAYCRGPYCVWADEAVERLNRLGFQARKLEEGVTEWTAAGLPIERDIARVSI